MDKISVIIPVYKVEPYLRQCLDSVLNQTYNNLEVILVDDGSPDGCPAICDMYALRDSRVTALHSSNGGQSRARNRALDCPVTGDYIAFVDSDDWLEPNMYEVLLKELKENDADIAVCQLYTNKNLENKRIPTGDNGERIVYDNFNDYCDNFFVPCQYEMRFEVWNKLYKKEVVDGLRFEVGKIYEDILYTKCAFEKARRVVCINTPLYNYRVGRPGSTISSFNISRLSKVDSIDPFIKYFANHGNKRLEQKYVYYAMNAILELYLLAQRHHASIKDKQALKMRFVQYYKYSQTKSMPIKTKFKVFNFSPVAYRFISSCITKLKNL